MKTLGSIAALVLTGLSLFVCNVGGQTETILYSFGSFPNDEAAPKNLVQGSDGNFYGTIPFGGISTNCPGGCGTVFRISPGGSYTSLYSFAGSLSDGSDPVAGLVQASDGNFYGTTAEGGANNSGTVFRLTISLNPPANQISAVQAVGNDMAVSVASMAGETYQLQFTTDLTSENRSNIGGALLPQGLYRFDIKP